MCNEDIRKEVYAAGLRLWHIAEALNIDDGNFSRKLRRELPEADKERIRKIISTLNDAKKSKVEIVSPKGE